MRSRMSRPKGRAEKGDHEMAKPMTKTQLVAALAEKMDTDKKTAERRWTR